jgi:hypothetical protein
MRRISIILITLMSAGCAGVYAQGKSEAEKEAAALRGDTKGAAVNNPRCKLFSAAEASRYIGATVSTVENAAAGSGCQWAVGGGNGSMMVQVLPASYHEPPKMAKGFKQLPGVGVEGFVLPELGGWGAGCISGKQAIRVSLDGKGASEQTAIELLKDTMKRQTAAASK